MIITNCRHCLKEFTPSKSSYYKRQSRGANPVAEFCSLKCHYAFKSRNTKTFQCAWCKKLVIRNSAEEKASKSGRHYCSRSCSASYNNTQKRRSHRSKCEEKLFNLLKISFPNLDLIANDKSLLNGNELDIAVPSLKLGIEWNGIVHFQPIYGENQLKRIQKKDAEKVNLSYQLGINLIIISDLASTDSKIFEAFIKISNIIQILQSDMNESNIPTVCDVQM